MKSFFNVTTTEDALELIRGFKPLGEETVPLDSALGRVLSRTVASPEDLPHFSRSTMDGYAVRARDTFGASEQLPSLLNVVGEIRMSQAPTFSLRKGEAAGISTGGMLPDGADAVLMVEYSRRVDDGIIEASRSVSPGENVIQRGEDLAKEGPALDAGTVLRPQDLGLLAGVGIAEVRVHRRPVVALLSTGDEIVSPEDTPAAAQVRDVNRTTLASLVRQAGGETVFLGLVKDDLDALKEKTREGLSKADVVLVSGGSSVGVRDFSLSAFESLPGAEILFHGLTISPGKPTILAGVGNRSVWGLPGHVTSAMVVFMVFVLPMLRVLSGIRRSRPDPFAVIPARLSRNLGSAQGRDDFVRVRLERHEDGWVALPVLGKSGLISTLVEADGLIRIDRHSEGLYAGEQVSVYRFNSVFEGI